MNKKVMIAIVAAAAVIVVAAWGFGWFGDGRYSSDPAVAELQRTRDEGFARMDEMSQADRQASRASFQQRMEGLSEPQRREFFESSMPMFMRMITREIDRFLELPPDEQRAEMDRRIDEMVARGGPSTPGGPASDPQRFDQMRKRALDWTTPEVRAKFETYMTKYNERMNERGVSSPPGFFPGRPF